MTGFDDGKEDGALRTIGEVGQAFGLKAHVLRYWEDQFPMLQPLKRSGGRRYYRPEDVALVETIDRLVNREGYTLKGARQAIEEGKVSASDAAVARAPRAEASEQLEPEATTGAESGLATTPSPVPPDIIVELKAIRERLAAAVGV